MRLLVRILAMANDANLDHGSRVVDRINNSVITYSYPPQVVSPPQLFAASRSRLFGEGVDLGGDPEKDTVGQRLELLGGRPSDPHLMHGGDLFSAGPTFRAASGRTPTYGSVRARGIWP